jgi:PAS domain-containing protein
VQLLNYKKDGSTFWNQLQLMPVKDATGRVTQYVGAQQDIRDAGIDETPHTGSTGGAAGSTTVVAADEDPMTSIASLLSCESEERSMLSVFPPSRETFVIANPHLPDCPMTHVSDGFLAMTGYSREEVVGRNCRFLQGPLTDQDTVSRLRDTVVAGGEITVKVTCTLCC